MYGHYPLSIVSGLSLVLCLIPLFILLFTDMINTDLILQVDATIITGALILLTVTSFVGKKHEPIETRDPLGSKEKIQWTPYTVASGTIMLFGLSAILVFVMDIFPILYFWCVLFTVFGFGYLIVSALVVGLNEYTKENKRK